MRNPRLWRNVGFAVVASGFAAGAAVLFIPDAALDVTPKTILACYALLAIIFGSMWTSWRHSEAVVQNALLRGDGVLARWRVDPGAWTRFCALNETFSVNECKSRLPAPAEGLEVIVGRHGVLIDGFLHKLIWPAAAGFGASGTGNWQVESASVLPGDPSCVNLRVKMSARHGSPVYSNLVFPIAPAAMDDALRSIPWTK